MECYHSKHVFSKMSSTRNRAIFFIEYLKYCSTFASCCSMICLVNLRSWVKKSNFQLCRNKSEIALGLVYCAMWLVQKTRATLPTNQMQNSVKPITTWSPAFSRAWGSLVVLTLISHWLSKVFSCLLIGRCDYFGFVLRHSIEKHSS